MMRQRPLWLTAVLGVLTAASLWACGWLSLPSSSSGAPGGTIPTPVLSGGSPALPMSVSQGQAAATPTSPASPAATPTPAGTVLTCGPFRITVPQALGIPFQCFQADFGYFDNPTTVPIHRLGLSASDIFCEHGCIDLIPVAQVQQTLGKFAFPPEGQNGTVVFEAVKQALTFQGGQPAERSLEIHGQALVMANNKDLRYIVRAMTVDGAYAVFVTLPIDATILPTDPDPALNTNPQALQPLPASISDVQAIEAYNQRAAQQLNQLPPDAFVPNLALLDQMVQSLVYAP